MLWTEDDGRKVGEPRFSIDLPSPAAQKLGITLAGAAGLHQWLLDIKGAYRKAALRWHPDKHTDSTDEEQAEAARRFQELNLAHSVLIDPVRKRQFDVGGRVRDIVK